jgi:hypothetical protein
LSPEHISGCQSRTECVGYCHHAADKQQEPIAKGPSAQLHMQLDAVRRGQYDLGSEQGQPLHINYGMQMDNGRNLDLALEGGAEISGPETNQGGDDYENRRRQIGAQTYRVRTPESTLLRTLWPRILAGSFYWLHGAGRPRVGLKDIWEVRVDPKRSASPLSLWIRYSSFGSLRH